MSDPTLADPALADFTLEELARRVDAAMTAVDELEPGAKSKALALKEAVEAFHKAGLTKIVRTLKDDPRGKELLFELAEDPAVYALFAMHGLVRADLPTRVARVLDATRPYLQSHGGDVELVEVREGRVYVRLVGACGGCSMSSVTLRHSVEQTLKEHLPEIVAVEEVNEESEGSRDLVSLNSGSAAGPEHG